MDLTRSSRRNFLSLAVAAGATALLPDGSSWATIHPVESPGRQASDDDQFVDEVEVRRCGRCAILPMSSYVHFLRGSSASISCSNPGEAIEVADLFVKDASHWAMSGIVVDDILRARCLGSADELSMGILRGRHPMLDRISSGGRISLELSYAGRHSSCPFEGCVIGRIRSERDESPWASRSGHAETVPVRADVDLQPDTSARITETLRRPMLVESIVVRDPDDWIVNDLRIDGRSQFVASGDVPAAALARVGELGLSFGVAREEIQLLVTHIGDRPARFRCEAAGRLLVA